MRIGERRQRIVGVPEGFSVDPLYVYTDIIGNAAMGHRLNQRLIGVL